MGRLKKGFLMVVLLSIAGVAAVTALRVGALTALAQNNAIELTGMFYEFDEKSHYEIDGVTPLSSKPSTLGIITLCGDVKTIPATKGFQSYEVTNGSLTLNYTLDSALTGDTAANWHVVDDKTKTVNGYTLAENILKASVIIQTSLTGDDKDWVTDVEKTDIVADTQFDPNIYLTREIQQINGCYYRVIIAYELSRQIEDKRVLFASFDNFEKKKCAEVYQFYVINSSENAAESISPMATPRKELGKVVNVEKDKGFFGAGQEPDSKDPHFGWDLGTFFLNGYTREQPVGENETPVFLKTVGDKVTLWFSLKEDINCLSGNSDYSIAEDKNGYDQHFGVKPTNFKHGALIIQYTDAEGHPQTPVVYTDYLAANARTGADTKVELFEEGDYEVALDYEILNSSGIDKYTDYKITFKFKIRNGNCMVYPFDVKTGEELADNAVTENGFKLDLAKSRYLTIDIVKNAVKYKDGVYTLDVRINTATQEGKPYESEGIYTFTVKNPTTSQSTTKTIYVGSDPIYKALSRGNTLEAINALIAEGGDLQEDGTVLMPEPEVDEEPEPEPEEAAEKAEKKENATATETETHKKDDAGTEAKEEETEETTEEEGIFGLDAQGNTGNGLLFGIVGVVVVAVGAAFAAIRKKSGKPDYTDREDEQR